MSTEVAEHVRNNVVGALPPKTRFVLIIPADDGDGAHLISNGVPEKELMEFCIAFLKNDTPHTKLPPLE